ncbi:unnamed protein product [Soboliphyme baturini]|uniref:Uncharacterized protein n=1 Tax=Soboliphyme baturini TaxID=241478 RepID=A0A183J9X7_9BILA|nr:unnamed protein product [Soboliphyme baturini]
MTSSKYMACLLKNDLMTRDSTVARVAQCDVFVLLPSTVFVASLVAADATLGLVLSPVAVESDDWNSRQPPLRPPPKLMGKCGFGVRGVSKTDKTRGFVKTQPFASDGCKIETNAVSEFQRFSNFLKKSLGSLLDLMSFPQSKYSPDSAPGSVIPTALPSKRELEALEVPETQDDHFSPVFTPKLKRSAPLETRSPASEFGSFSSPGFATTLSRSFDPSDYKTVTLDLPVWVETQPYTSEALPNPHELYVNFNSASTSSSAEFSTSNSSTASSANNPFHDENYKTIVTNFPLTFGVNHGTSVRCHRPPATPPRAAVVTDDQRCRDGRAAATALPMNKTIRDSFGYDILVTE